MRKVSFLLCVAMCASQAFAWGFTENFNSYAGGSNNWNSGGKWTEPTVNLRLDSFTADDTLGPRTGNTNLRYATAPLGSQSGAFTFSSDSYWSNTGSAVDAVFIVLSDGLATAQQVPTTSAALGAPINAIAWGHVPGLNETDYAFFNGQTWTVIGQSNATFNRAGEVKVAGSVDAAGNWSAGLTDFNTAAALGSNSGTLAVPNFAFSELTIISQGNASQVYSGVDNINITPEPATAGLLGLAFVLLRRRRA